MRAQADSFVLPPPKPPPSLTPSMLHALTYATLPPYATLGFVGGARCAQPLYGAILAHQVDESGEVKS
jgi:hypothetical protein